MRMVRTPPISRPWKTLARAAITGTKGTVIPAIIDPDVKDAMVTVAY
jgi:hypothetical protein